MEVKAVRIVKEPEERKQEILETAMRLFYEKGYEKTSITDIAQAIGIAQGLCYRYFPSKENLFDSAVDQYAQQLADKLTGGIKADRPLKELLASIPLVAENEESLYYGVLHQQENKKFHDQLALKVCEKLLPLVRQLLQQAQDRGELQLADVDAAASFCTYGQLGILLNTEGDIAEREQRIRDFLTYALRL